MYVGSNLRLKFYGGGKGRNKIIVRWGWAVFLLHLAANVFELKIYHQAQVSGSWQLYLKASPFLGPLFLLSKRNIRNRLQKLFSCSLVLF